MRHRIVAFTIIELLVVITIIVVLLALLTPALDRALYQAELALCGGNLRGIANGAALYAYDNGRRYPYRETYEFGYYKRPTNIVDAAGNQGQSDAANSDADDRKYLRDHFQWDMFLDPLGGQIDVNSQRTQSGVDVFVNYALWFGTELKGAGRMNRVGQDLAYLPGDGTSYRFNLLASDWDAILVANNQTHASHPDTDGVQFFQVQTTGAFELSRWNARPTYQRSATDLNYAVDDGSVFRLEQIRWDEYAQSDRVIRVPFEAARPNNVAGIYAQIPSKR